MTAIRYCQAVGRYDAVEVHERYRALLTISALNRLYILRQFEVLEESVYSKSFVVSNALD